MQDYAAREQNVSRWSRRLAQSGRIFQVSGDRDFCMWHETDMLK
jgi:hypothetical protein